MSLDRLTCLDHGWFSHFGIHEAGHAVAAIRLGFKFVSVSIVPGHNVYRQMTLGEAVVGAGVLMPTDQPAEWVGPRPDDALVYVLAGSLAEKEVLGHFLVGGYQGDVDIWRRGTGRFEAQTDELKPLLTNGIERATALVNENRDAILRVYGLMVERVPNNGTRVLGFDEPLVLSYDEVYSAVVSGS